MTRIAILGAGNAGCAMAADLTLRGHRVTLCTRDPERLRRLRENGGIDIQGVLGSRHVQLAHISDDLPSALAEAELAVLVVPGMVQEDYLRSILPHLRSEQALWLCPGNGGSLLAAQMLEKHNVGLLLIETWSIPYGARRTGAASVHIRALIRPQCAAFPARRNPEALALVRECFPESEMSENVLETTLMNVNCIVHPLPTLMNWGCIELRSMNFSLYREGMTRGVLRCLYALDRERVAVCSAAGLRSLAIDDIYAAQKVPRLYLNEAEPYPPHADRLEERFIIEDVPVGLVTVASVGRQFGVATPLTLAVIGMANALFDRDFLETGRTAEKLRLAGLSPGQARAFLYSGEL